VPVCAFQIHGAAVAVGHSGGAGGHVGEVRVGGRVRAEIARPGPDQNATKDRAPGYQPRLQLQLAGVVASMPGEP